MDARNRAGTTMPLRLHLPSAPRPLPVSRAAEVRALEQQAFQAGHTDLMERAGLAAADRAEHHLGRGEPVLVLAGPGNNGGDALVAARHLRARWHTVEVVLWGAEKSLPPDAARALHAWKATGGACRKTLPSPRRWGLVVDGLFGIGLTRDLDATWTKRIAAINALGAPILSLDVPSGLDADTGQPRGAAVRATATLTFLALKPGLLTAGGPDHCGDIHLDTLGLPARKETPGHLLGPAPESLARLRRPQDSHKGCFGSVGILGGAPGMTGAAFLAARAALLTGAGRVYAAFLDRKAPSLDVLHPEIMFRAPEHLLTSALSCLVIGPGIGLNAHSRRFLAAALQRNDLPLVLDADALTLIAEHPALAKHLGRRDAPALLTPHPAEAARLLGCDTLDVQRDRLAATLELAHRFRASVALKGVGTLCAHPDGQWAVNPSGNPGMASAGMGDVLSGLAGSLLAQGLPAREALELAVHLHGVAADDLLPQHGGPLGMTAGEVAGQARQTLNRWVGGYAP